LAANSGTVIFTMHYKENLEHHCQVGSPEETRRHSSRWHQEWSCQAVCTQEADCKTSRQDYRQLLPSR